MKAFNRPIQTGFTLIEMLVTISVLGIIASIAAPSFQNQIAKRKMEDAFNQIETCFKESRIEANITRNPVTVRFNAQTLNCATKGNIEFASPLSVVAFRGTPSIRFNANGTVDFVGTSSATLEETFQICYNDYAQGSIDLTINSRGRLSRNTGGRTCSA